MVRASVGAKAQFQITVEAKEESGDKAASFEEGDLKVAHTFTTQILLDALSHMTALSCKGGWESDPS